MAVEAAERLEKDGKKARVVSMVGWELFEQQPQSYKASVIPQNLVLQYMCTRLGISDDGMLFGVTTVLAWMLGAWLPSLPAELYILAWVSALQQLAACDCLQP